MAAPALRLREVKRRRVSDRSPKSPRFPLQLLPDAPRERCGPQGLPSHSLHRARRVWLCAGDGSSEDPRFARFAPACSVEVRRGEPHLEVLDYAAPYAVGSKHCAACSVEFFQVRWRDAEALEQWLAALPASIDRSGLGSGLLDAPMHEVLGSAAPVDPFGDGPAAAGGSACAGSGEVPF